MLGNYTHEWTLHIFVYIADEFRSVGQNIGIITGNYTYFNQASDVINLYFDIWFDEYKDCNMSYIDDYQILENKLELQSYKLL